MNLFDALRAEKRKLTLEPLGGLTQAEVDTVNALLARWTAAGAAKAAPKPITPPQPAAATEPRLTARVAMELIGHEAIVREAYKDSVGVWTWGIGVTNASGHTVFPRYKDNPQSIERCIEVFIWLLRNKYIPAVEKAFTGLVLTEAQFAAALSFHYNTGAIRKADWVIRYRAGDLDAAKRNFLNWRKPPEIIPRRTKERDLFFDGKWSQDGKATVYPVKKPSYTPDWSGAKRVDISDALKRLLP